MINKATIVGRLGRDPETKHLPTTTLTTFSIATSETWKDKDGQKQEKTEWINCKAFGKLAEICGTYLAKGSLVYVEGKLQTTSWEAEGEQKPRYKTEIVLTEMKMLSPKGEGKQSSGPEQSFDTSEEIPF